MKSSLLLKKVFRDLKTIEILNSAAGKADLRYDFEQLGVRESALHFDAEGKIVRIELVENLIAYFYLYAIKSFKLLKTIDSYIKCILGVFYW